MSVTDKKLLKSLKKIIEAADLSDEGVTAKTIRIKLEQKLGIDLSDRKTFLKEQITALVQQRNAEEAEEEEEAAAVVDDSDAGEFEDAPAVPAKLKKPRAAKPSAAGGAAPKRKRAGGFGMVDVSAAMGALLGSPGPVPRTEVTKRRGRFLGTLGCGVVACFGLLRTGLAAALLAVR
jgi:upstream activation factor subunit UAF30